MNIKFALAICLILLGSLGAAARAHTSLESASPAGGSELAQSPSAIEIKFRGSVNLTSVVAVGPDKTERKLSFVPTSSAERFTIANPVLPAGRSEIRWKALSKDGHVVSGSLVYVVKTAAGQTKN